MSRARDTSHPLPPGNFDQSAAPALDQHLPEPLPADPFPLFVRWFEEAQAGLATRILPNPNAMSLATVDPDGRLSNRIVLCKAVDAAAGSLTFYTNYQGRKGRALDANPRCAACFHWDPIDRQARFEGLAARLSADQSDAYFASRPWISRIGAWASDQSRPIASRAELESRTHAAMRGFGIDPDNPPAPDAAIDIPRPPHWGGYRVTADRVELWVGAKGRLHDRAVWSRDPVANGPWHATRLQP